MWDVILFWSVHSCGQWTPMNTHFEVENKQAKEKSITISAKWHRQHLWEEMNKRYHFAKIYNRNYNQRSICPISPQKCWTWPISHHFKSIPIISCFFYPSKPIINLINELVWIAKIDEKLCNRTRHEQLFPFSQS